MEERLIYCFRKERWLYGVINFESVFPGTVWVCGIVEMWRQFWQIEINLHLKFEVCKLMQKWNNLSNLYFFIAFTL